MEPKKPSPPKRPPAKKSSARKAKAPGPMPRDVSCPLYGSRLL